MQRVLGLALHKMCRGGVVPRVVVLALLAKLLGQGILRVVKGGVVMNMGYKLLIALLMQLGVVALLAILMALGVGGLLRATVHFNDHNFLEALALLTM